MNLTLFYTKQLELESFVRLNLNIPEEEFVSDMMVDKRIFAFKVELAELANETAWFKYWKQSHKPDPAAVIEELADCIHFLTAIGIYRNYRFITEITPEPWTNASEQALYGYLMNNDLASSGKWKNAFEQLIAIGLKLGFSLEEQIHAYLAKNKKNVERQKDHY